MSIDLTPYTIVQLESIAVQVQQEIKRKQSLAKSKLIADLERVARDAGVSLAELFGSTTVKTEKKPRTIVAIKYINPNNPDQTWTGRGRQPLWLVALLAEGKTLESLSI